MTNTSQSTSWGTWSAVASSKCQVLGAGGIGEAILAACKTSAEVPRHEAAKDNAGAKTDLASLSSMLAARWKSGAVAESSNPQEIQAGQVRKFRITKLDRTAKKIEVESV